jgi:hypothetical protein
MELLSRSSFFVGGFLSSSASPPELYGDRRRFPQTLLVSVSHPA